jgi:signal transduction histidine kinase
VVITTAIGIRTESRILNDERARFEEMLDTIDLHLKTEKRNLEKYREEILDNRKKELRNLSSLVSNYFDGYLARHKQGEMSLAQAQRAALEGIAKFKYGNDDYFFIFNSELVIISHPKKALIGIDAKKVTDKKGKFHIREIHENALALGEGTSFYHWDRLGENGEFEKLGYGIIYKPWNWLIVSGVYIDDIKYEVKKRKKELIRNLEGLFVTLQGDKESYTYLFDSNGKTLIHPVLKGLNLKQITHPNPNVKMYDEHLKAAESNQVFEYTWNKPNDVENYIYKKIAFVRKFEPFDWYVAHSVYIEDLEKAAASTIEDIVLISFSCLVLFLPLAFLIANKISGPIKDLSSLVENADPENLEEVKVKIEGPKEIEELSVFIQNIIDSINNMMGENKVLVQKLEDHQANLENVVGNRTNELNKKNENLKCALKDLNRFKDKLVAQEKLASLGSLSAGIAHEIKNPLNLIVNSAKLIEMKLSDISEHLSKLTGHGDFKNEVISDISTLNDLSKVIISNSDRSERIIHSMLQQSRTGEFDKFETVDINIVIEEYWNLAFHSMRANDPINVSLHKKVDRIGMVSLIPKDFGRLLLNLFENSFYALRDKARYEEDFVPQVWVYVEMYGDESFCIRVKDNGMGIDEEEREKILEPFFTTKPTGEGTGLGLSMVHDIVLAHQGEIRISSEEGEFTEFAIIIPLGLNKNSDNLMAKG